MHYTDINQLSWVLGDAAFAFGILFVFGNFNLKSPKSWLCLLAEWLALWGLEVLIESLFYMGFGNAFAKQIVYPSFLVLYLVAVILTDKQKRSSWMLQFNVGGIYYSLFLCCMHIAVSAGMLTGFKYTSAYVVFMYPALIIFLNAVSFKSIKSLPGYFYIINTIISASTIFLIYLFETVVMTKYNNLTYGLISHICMLIIGVSCYYVFYRYAKALDRNQFLLIQSLKNEQLAKIYRLNESVYEEMQKFRHDTRNRYIYMKELIRNKEYGKLNDYFKELTDDFNEIASVVDCGNKTLNNILNLSLTKAKAAGVDIDWQIAVERSLPVSDYDLYTLFSNLIDNAVEGLARIEDESKTIKLTVRENQNNLFVYIANRCDCKISGGGGG